MSNISVNHSLAIAQDNGTAAVEAASEISKQVPTFADLLPEQAQPYWEIIQAYPIIEAAIIFLVFWASASLIRLYALNLVKKLTSKTSSQLDDKIIEDLRNPIFKTVVWFGLIVASKSTGYTDGFAAYISPVALSMIILAWTRAVLSISGSLITTMSRDTSRFKSMDVRTEPLLIISSKIICFAAKDTLANLFSGVFILADRPYKLGDYINLDSGERGRVTHIGIRSTRLITRDDIEVTIPNGVIGNQKIVNENGGPGHSMRIRLNLQCAYEANLEHVEQVLMNLINDQDEIRKHPVPRVRFRGFGDSGINLQLMGWIDEPRDRGRISHMLYKEIHRTFQEQGLEIPYPKRDVTIIKQADD